MALYDDSVPRDLNYKLGEIPSVLDFGARGDGASNDAPAIQRALDAVASAGRSYLYVPATPASYLLNSRLTIPSRIKLVGDGPHSKFLRGAAIPAGYGLFNISGFDVRLDSIAIDGAVTTPTGITYGELFDGGGINGNPVHNTLTANTSIWIHGGARNIRLRGVTVMHTGGYAVLIDARTADVEDVSLESCSFENNRPHLFGDAGDTTYGAWTGGVLYQGDGYSYRVRRLRISHCRFARMAGNCCWGHSYNFDALHETVEVIGCDFEDVGRDGVLIGNTRGALVNSNTFRRVGYVADDDVNPSVPKYYPGQYAVAIDTSGCVRSAVYSSNAIESCNGGAIDLDGFLDGLVVSNTVVIAASGEPGYTQDQIAAYGPPGLPGNYTRGVNTGNTYYPDAAQRIVISNNALTNCGGGGIALNAARDCYVSGNRIQHPAVTSPEYGPIVLTNRGAATHERSTRNEVAGNTIHYTGALACVAELDTVFGAPLDFDAGQANRVWGNRIFGANDGEFRKAALSSSRSAVEFPSNDPTVTQTERNIVQREGAGAAATLKIYRQRGATTRQLFQLADDARLNVSDNGAPNSGAVTTGNRTTAGTLQDFVFAGKGIFDGFLMLGRHTFSDAEANQFPSDYWILRRKPDGSVEQSTEASGGVRVWSSFGGLTEDLYRPVRNPLDYGARFDNTSHPASGVYPDLAALQAAYPLTHAFASANAGWFPAIALTDEIDWLAIQEAILDVPLDGGTVVLPPGRAWVNRTLHVGDGTATSFSTRNNIMIIGAGGGNFDTGQGKSAPGQDFRRFGGTVIRTAANLSGPVMQVNGPITNVRFADFVLDAVDQSGYTAPACLTIYHSISGVFERLYLARPATGGWALICETRSTSISELQQGMSQNTFEHLFLYVPNDSANGWKFGEAGAQASNLVGDINRATARRIEIIANDASTGTALQLGLCDACVFEECFSYGFAGSGAAHVRIRPATGITAHGNPAHVYPDNVIFRGCFWSNASTAFVVSDSDPNRWSPGNGGVLFENLGQESNGTASIPLMPSSPHPSTGKERFAWGWTMSGALHRMAHAQNLTMRDDVAGGALDWVLAEVFASGQAWRAPAFRPVWINSDAYNALDIFSADPGNGNVTGRGGAQVGRMTFVELSSSPAGASGKSIIWMEGGKLKAREGTGSVVELISGGSGAPYPDATYLMQLDNGGNHFMAAYDAGNGADHARRPALLFRRAAGTVASPAALSVDGGGTRLGAVAFQACTTGGGSPTFQTAALFESYCYGAGVDAVSGDFRVTTYNAGSGVNSLRVSPNGQTSLGSVATPVDTRLFLEVGTASWRGLVVRGAASQSANLAEYYSSANALLAAVSAGGAATYQALTLAVDSVTPASTTGGKYGAREIRFRQESGEEASAGLIAHRPSFASTTLSVVGAGTTAGTRLINLYDRVTISGADLVAALTLTDGFVSSADGYYSASSATNAVDIPTGGVTARWLIGTRSLTLAGAAAGDAGLSSSGQGRIYFDSSTNKFRVSENGGPYVDLLGGTSSITGCFYANRTGGQSYRLVDNDVSRFHGQAEGAQATLTLDVYANSAGASICPLLIARRSNGTNAAPSYVNHGENLFIIGARGWFLSGTEWTTAFTAAMFFRVVAESPSPTYWTSTSQGSQIVFATTPSGSTSRADRLWIHGNGYVDIAGVNGSPALRLLDGYVQSDEGYYSANNSYQTVNIPNGGLYARSLHAIVYSQVGQSSGAPTGTTGASIIAGAITWRTDLSKLQVYNGSSWVDVAGSGAVSSVSGTANQITASPTTGNVVLSFPNQVIFPGQSGAAGVALAEGYFQSNSSTGGFLSNGTAYNTFQTTSGGVKAKGLYADFVALTSQSSQPSISGESGVGLRIWYNSASSRVEIGASLYCPGVSCEGNGVGGNLFRYWNGSSYENGVTATVPASATLSVKGGIIVGWS